jgi:hypothetical protein
MTRSPAGRAGAGSNVEWLASPGAEGATGERNDLFVRDVAGGRHHYVAGSIGGGPEGAQIGLGQAANALLAASDLATQRRVAEHRQIEEGVDVLAGIVEIGPDLLDDDGPLRLDLVAFAGSAGR